MGDRPNDDACWDCGHRIDEHSGEYRGWDLRDVPREQRPPKTPGCGCLHEGCDCRRWFLIESGGLDD
jgi:hypothetical protein